MTTHEIRSKYLEFFKSREHAVLPSASLVPENDPTTLFTGSGMQPMIPYLLGQKHPAGTRLADSQKCFRSQDIEEVGDNRHTVFFEMLGNWSLGDYFKQEQISWMWEFLTHELKLDPQRLYFTCFRGNEELGIPKDIESSQLWQKLLQEGGIDAKIVDFPERDGLQGGRIFYYSEDKNWWSRSGTPDKMPVGEPGGPDTEMFWDFGVELQLHANSSYKDQPCHVNCDCGRFLEIGNNVFMEYVKTDRGFDPLPQKNVDFGGGLERLAVAVRDNNDIFTIDLFDGMRQTLESLAQKKYGENEKDSYAFRVIMDHLRAATFLIADGIVPGNKDQYYFTRRLIRRAVRFGNTLGIKEVFCSRVAEQVIETYKDAYPALQEKKQIIMGELEKEEIKFRKTLYNGLKVLDNELKTTIRKIDDTNPYHVNEGEHVPMIITGKWMFTFYESYGFPFELLKEELISRNLIIEQDVPSLKEQFDVAKIEHQNLSRATSEQKFKGGLADHSEMSVKYHTATHLLHAALQKVLGPQAVQKGSNITPERLRFDFVHSEKMTSEQVKATEDLVNAAIVRDYPVSWQELPLEQARQKKAIGLFGENYGTLVKVYTVGDPEGLPEANPLATTFSRELCGGPHVEHTGVLGKFKIVKEEACSAGIRRIKAILSE